ncbi:MAG TPA: dTMP kinase [Methanocella sp.]|uniref:dTMP kinase n=1 Tax=Methanocella sp. TaxID=2052833 RepID=UPI002D088F07|nr:dTMP kinase [Methanocella sp.]HTY89581.1 dTMP kinase [Methanocella sp.]
MTRRGYLITIEGIDGTGKTTQVQLLKEWLDKHGIDAVALKEPTQGRYGQEIARRARSGDLSSENELRLFMEDRREDVEKSIRPALDAGKAVIMDRYYLSNMAYQGARGLDPERIRRENEAFSPIPDLIIILDISPEKSMARVNARKNVVGHFENAQYLEKVRDIFLAIGKQPNAMVIDTGAPIADVHRRIVDAVCELMHVFQ